MTTETASLVSWWGMLEEFITTHREQIIARARANVNLRTAPRPTESELAHGVPLFLDHLTVRLRTVAVAGGDALAASASLRGGELLSAGFTIRQVVEDYGNICQAITNVAVERGAEISTEDFRTLNMCLDIAVADAVSEYARQSDEAIKGRGVEHLGFLAHELRNHLNAAMLAFEAIQSGAVAPGGTTAGLVARSLAGMRDLVTRSLAEVRLESGPPRVDRVIVASLLEEIEIAAAMQAKAHDVQLQIKAPKPHIAITGDAQIVSSIITNLVQNACKFTRPRGMVIVGTRETADRILIDIADECGGLPPGKAEELFQPFAQRHADRTGLGLGLAISLKGAQALGGDLLVANIPGMGCVFSVELRKWIDV